MQVRFKGAEIIADLKLCPRCYLEKEIVSFSRNKNRKDGLQIYCKACSISATMESRPKTDKYSKYQSENRHMSHLTSIKARAKKKGLPFNLTLEDLIDIPEICPVLGLKLERNLGNCFPSNNSPSVDRIIPELGYVKGNILIISNLANKIKQDATPEQIIKVGKFYASWNSKPSLSASRSEDLQQA